jgi:hypothetical protein
LRYLRYRKNKKTPQFARLIEQLPVLYNKASMDKAEEMMRIDYFIGYGLPAKVTYIEKQVEVLTY